MSELTPEDEPKQTPDETIRDIQRDLQNGGPLAELLNPYEEKQRAEGIIKLVAEGRLSPDYRTRSLNDLIQETTLVLSSDILVGSEDRSKYEHLNNIYSYFRDKVDSVETYDDMLTHLESGNAQPEVVSMWLEEHMITVDAIALQSIKKGGYDLSSTAQHILDEKCQQLDVVELLLKTTMEVQSSGSATDDASFTESMKTVLFPKSTLTEDQKNEATTVTRELNVKIEPVLPENAAQFRKIMIEWATEFPQESGMPAETYAADPPEVYQSELQEFHSSGGCFYGAFSEGKLVGVLQINPPFPLKVGLLDPEVRHTSAIQTLYVSPEARRAGLEAGLIKQAIAHAQTDEKSGWVMGLVGDSAERLRKLYEQEGFKSNGMFVENGKYSEMFEIELKKGDKKR